MGNDRVSSSQASPSSSISGTDAEELRRLGHNLRHRDIMLALTQDDMRLAESLSRLLIAERYGADS